MSLQNHKLISLIIADHKEIVRSGLRYIFEDDGRFELIEETDNGEDIVELADYFNPDVILIDSKMPRLSGFEAGKLIKNNHPDIKVVVFSPDDEENEFFMNFECADGIFSKNIGSYVLTEAVYRIVNGEKLLCNDEGCKCLQTLELHVV